MLAPRVAHTGSAQFFPRHDDVFIESAFEDGGSGYMDPRVVEDFPRTLRELDGLEGNILQQYGAHTAIDLDGGGSTTLAIDSGDGSARLFLTPYTPFIFFKASCASYTRFSRVWRLLPFSSTVTGA